MNASVDMNDAWPTLTLPEKEAAWLREAYEGASAILEYGSGGSTVMAASMPGKTVWSVESDKDWAAALAARFDKEPLASPARLYPVDIGPTKEWGRPKSEAGWRKFARYPMAVWEEPEMPHPDVVLIDGRFRAACFMATMYHCKRPVSVYFDDYVNRKQYHVVEKYHPVVETRGRMVRFEVVPRKLEPSDILRFCEALGLIR